MRALARVGITALVDEATGYQHDREQQELQRILAAYLSPHLVGWAKTFPDDFYFHLFRLRGWSFDSQSNRRPRDVGRLTSVLIYKHPLR
ncbi:MAG: P63C domain-containing protein [Acidobacteriota bacterium]